MQSKHLRLLLFFAALWSACARPGTPSGGLKDTEPPKIDSTRSTPNFTTRFKQKKIELTFDEWIILKDVGQQLLISPPPAKKPDVRIKGKTVVVEFDPQEAFRENTTYTLNFGTAVRDLHEENPAQDLRFVFSTGAVLDSLRLGGIVTDAYSGEPVENVAVALYDPAGSDSLPAKERPYYFARTDKSGQFAIANLRAGRFLCAAFEDGSQNLRLDPGSERVDFPDSLVGVSEAGTAPLALRLFKNSEKTRLLESRTKTYGQIQLLYNGDADTLKIQSAVSDMRLWTARLADSLVVWYDYPRDTLWNLLAGADTIPVKAGLRGDFLKNRRLVWADATPAAAGGGSRRKPAAADASPAPDTAGLVSKTVTLRPGKPLELPFNGPVQSVDTTRCLLQKDSATLEPPRFVFDAARPDLLRLAAPLSGAGLYRLLLAPGAVTDVYGIANKDTLARLINLPDEKQLGGLNLTLRALKPGAQYVLYLYNDKILEETERFTAEGDARRVLFSRLPAAALTIRLVEDTNGDGHWTSGDYYARRQPEPIFTKKLEPLRANWEVEIEWSASASSGKRDRF
ncbi:MAG: Ig-like domain-containing protein [Saprospiraceae bacterium]